VVDHTAARSLDGIRQRLTVRARRSIAVATLCLLVVWPPDHLLALEVQLVRLRVAGPRVQAALEVRDLLRDKFLQLVRDGRAVFIQLDAELWEDRRVFDRIVITAPPATWRVDRDAAGGEGVVLQDQHGDALRHADVRQPLPLRVDLGAATRVEDDLTYYIHATITAATVDERDIDQTGQAIFGDEQTGRGLAGLGRIVFKGLLRMGKYFESATAEVTSRRLTGKEIRTGAL
jgi:hypothetical protein